jgi:hypothetical protein
MSYSPIDEPAGDRGRYGNTDQTEDPEGHVFVDSSGRRALLLRRAAIVFGAAVLAYGAMLGVAFMGGPSLAPAELAPFDSVGNTQDSGGTNVRPDSSPAAQQSSRPCRKKCARFCRKHLDKPCTWQAFRKAARAAKNRPSSAPSTRPSVSP